MVAPPGTGKGIGNSGLGGANKNKDNPAGNMGGFSLKDMKLKGLKDLSPKSKTSKSIGKGLLDKDGNMGPGPTIGSPEIPTVPSRTRTLNFKRAPTLSELETMAAIAGGVITGSPMGVAKSIADSLNSPADFQGAASQGSGTEDVKGTPGSKEIGDNITEEEKKRRELLARGTLLGATTIGNTLGTPMNPTPI